MTRGLLTLVMLGAAPMLIAHPHNWIALNSVFVLDDDSRLVSLTQRWEFDVYYSMMTMADVLNEYPSEEIGLPATASDMVRNLKAYDYFSSLTLDGEKVSLSAPGSFALRNKQKEGQLVLELEMTFEFEPGLAVESKALALQIYDPTYFIAMNHASVENIQIEGGDAVECAVKLEFPEPSDELIDYAQSLDRNQKDTDGLGASFAETATIFCV